MNRIPLGNTVFEGHNNVYLFPDDPVTLVDTGVAVDDTYDRLRSGLEGYDTSIEDVEQILLTHYHPDHAGLAGTIQRESGATVYVHEMDAPLVAGEEAAWNAVEEGRLRRYDKWGMPLEKQEELESFFFNGPNLYGEPPTVETITEGDSILAGSVRLEVLHTPGHAAGHSCFVARDEDTILTGDALLPVYTPNVGGADIRVDRALEQYLTTLRTLIHRDDGLALPGHRDPIEDPAGKARSIIEHHEERALRVLTILEDVQPADAWTISDHLFGELESVHILHGPGEASAHLEHLARTGKIIRTDDGYRLGQEVAELVPRLDGRFPLCEDR